MFFAHHLCIPRRFHRRRRAEDRLQVVADDITYATARLEEPYALQFATGFAFWDHVLDREKKDRRRKRSFMILVVAILAVYISRNRGATKTIVPK